MARLTVRVGPLDGAALRKARTDADRLIREVAEEAQITRGFLGQLELGHRAYMSHKAFRRLAAALKADPTTLLAEAPFESGGQATPPADVDVPDLRDVERTDADDLPQRESAPAASREVK